MQVKKTNSRQDGFSLLEALIAMSLLTISLLALAQLMLVSLDKTEFAKYDTKAINLAQAKLEELRTQFGWEIQTGQSASELAAGSHGPETITFDLPENTIQGIRFFQVSWAVTDLASGQKTVSVSVSPQNGNPLQSETITVSTNLAP